MPPHQPLFFAHQKAFMFEPLDDEVRWRVIRQVEIGDEHGTQKSHNQRQAGEFFCAEAGETDAQGVTLRRLAKGTGRFLFTPTPL